MSLGDLLVGKWYNELGSCMSITAAKEGMLTGLYESKVGDAEYAYVLTGRYDPLQDRRSLGWTVTWVNPWHSTSKSTTAWCGQYQLLPGTNEPQILTTWLLTVQTLPNQDWNSTNVGFDVFKKCTPDEATILKAKQQGHISHPKEAAKEQ